MVCPKSLCAWPAGDGDTELHPVGEHDIPGMPAAAGRATMPEEVYRQWRGLVVRCLSDQQRARLPVHHLHVRAGNPLSSWLSYCRLIGVHQSAQPVCHICLDVIIACVVEIQDSGLLIFSSCYTVVRPIAVPLSRVSFLLRTDICVSNADASAWQLALATGFCQQTAVVKRFLPCGKPPAKLEVQAIGETCRRGQSICWHG